MHAQPLSAYYHDTFTYKVAVYAPAEMADTLPVFHLNPICTLWFRPPWDGASLLSHGSGLPQAVPAAPATVLLATPIVLLVKLTALLATFAERNGKVPSWLSGGPRFAAHLCTQTKFPVHRREIQVVQKTPWKTSAHMAESFFAP
jgi:hypothetical protein